MLKITEWAVTALVILGALTVQAQTSDVLKYYIVYDVSGSVANIDRHNNLQKSLFRLLDVLEDSSKWNEQYRRSRSFNFYQFGEGVGNPFNFSAYSPMKLKGSEIVSASHKGRGQLYSDIKSALQMALMDVNKYKDEQAGLFIFTDGSFRTGDLPPGGTTEEQYRQQVDVLLLELKKSLGPDRVFIIQTSDSDPQFGFANKVEPPAKSIAPVAMSKGYLWLDARFSTRDSLSSAYLDRFLQEANAIISANEFLPLEDELQVMITLQEIWSVWKEVEEFLGKSESLPFKHQVLRLDTLLQQTSLSGKEVIEAKGIIKGFANQKPLPDDKKKLFNDIGKKENGSLFLNVLKKKVQNEAFTKEISASQSGSGFLSRSKDVAAATTPLRLTETYSPAEATPITASVRQNKSWESLEQTILEGTADYLIKRSKMEITYAFIENLQEYVFSKEPKTKLLFPNTARFTTNQDNAYDLVAFREVVKTDLNTLPERVLQYPELIRSEKLYSFCMFMHLYQGLMVHGSIERSVGSLVDLLSTKTELKSALEKTRTGKALMLSINLINDLNKYDLAKAFENAKSDTELIALAKMLLIHSLDASNLERLNQLEEVALEIKRIYRDYTIVKAQVLRLQALAKENPTSDFEQYRIYQKNLLMDILKSSASLLTSGGTVMRYLELSGETRRDFLKIITALDTFEKRLSVYDTKAITKEDYRKIVDDLRDSLVIRDKDIKKWLGDLAKNERVNGTVVDEETYRLIRKAKSRAMDFVQVSDESLFTAMHKGVEAWFQIKEGDYAPAMFTLAAGFKEVLSDDNRVAITLLTASGELASAKSPDEVSATIARYALPVASHKVKKTNDWTLMLGSYVGLSGVRFAANNELDVNGGAQLIAAIGPEFTTRLWGEGPFSFMVTILDLGNIVQFRLSPSSDSSKSDDVSFSRVLSPGLLFGYSPFSKLPLAFTASYMMNPHRFQLGATLDMPLVGIAKNNWGKKKWLFMGGRTK